MKKLLSPLKSKGGMTLVEVIAASVILIISTMLLLTAFGGAFSMVRTGADSDKYGNQAFAEIERAFASGEVPAGSAAKTIKFKAGGREYSVSGHYIVSTVGDPEGDSAAPDVDLTAFIVK